MWTDGLIRLFPPWEIYIGNHTIPAAVWVAVLMGVIFLLLIAYPFIERKFTGDNAHHNLLQRPRDVPVRTGIGAMAIAFYMLLTYSAMNDIIAYKFHISLNATTWIGRIGMLVLPPLVFFITYRWAVSLQRSDRDVLAHGIETGIIKRMPHGAYVELHQPLGPVDEHGHPIPLAYEGSALPKRMNKLGAGGRPGRGSFLTADPVAQDAALNEASHASEQRALTALKEYQSYEYSGNGSNGNGSNGNGSNGNGSSANGSSANGSNGHGSNGHH
jgi:ubiquinol-cytochrome c reductase cytochrome b subunit